MNWRKCIRDYFSFTKKERVGIVVLLLLVLAVFFVPKIFSRKKELLTIEERDMMKDFESGQFKKDDHAETYPREDRRSEYKYYRKYPHTSRQWNYKSNNDNYDRKEYPKHEKKPLIVDINKADSAELEKLPGIGKKLAGRIIHFREKLGGFYDINQVSETYGLADSTFHLIEPMLRIAEPNVAKININKSDVYQLRKHPYIGWPIANVLIRYRQQHGDFKSVDAIREIGAISPDVAIKLLPYLSID